MNEGVKKIIIILYVDYIINIDILKRITVQFNEAMLDICSIIFLVVVALNFSAALNICGITKLPE